MPMFQSLRSSSIRIKNFFEERRDCQVISLEATRKLRLNGIRQEDSSAALFHSPMNSLRIRMRSLSTGVEMTKQFMNANSAVW